MAHLPARHIVEKNEDEFEIVPDMPAGPLDEYRRLASFNWKDLRSFIEEEDALRFKTRVWRTMEADPLFQHDAKSHGIEEQRRITHAQMRRIRDYNFVSDETAVNEPKKHLFLVEALNQYDPSLMIKFTVPFHFFVSSVRGLGTEKHSSFIEQADKMQIAGCFGMTEIGHGNNTKGLRTTATFDPTTQEFILHTPDFEAAKCWAGALGQSSTHITVFAQLVTAQGASQGLHAFLVPIRDPKTMRSYPGVIVGDMGEKIGLNGVDNGFLMFSHYRVPRESLLDRTGTVKPDGTYVSPFNDPNKRFGASLGSLMGARMAIISLCATNLGKAVVIATRYSALRRQFGRSGDTIEQPVLEYQLQQWRLLPYLCGTFVLWSFSRLVLNEYVALLAASVFEQDKERVSLVGIELHALLSAAKPLGSWLAQRGIQDCREACGGHGYLKAAGFGELRNANDANCTYEGDNNVLLQQTSNWLLQLWRVSGQQDVSLKSPLGAVAFLKDVEAIKRSRFDATSVDDFMKPEVILAAYSWLLCWLLESTEAQYQANLRQGKDPFTGKNDAQVFHARSLSLAFIEHFCLLKFWERANEPDTPASLKPILTKITCLFGNFCLEQHLATLYQGGYASGPAAGQLVRQAIIQLCSELKNEAVALADALSPPDFILNSALGASHGEIYKALQASFYQNSAVFERPAWWLEMIPRQKL